jgi:hypothetical protein
VSPFASVEIHGNTPGQVKAGTIDVFGKNGYALSDDRKEDLVFEKRAGAWNNLAYGGWPGETPVWLRLRVSIRKAPELGVRLECRAFRVLDHGGPTEEETPVRAAGHGPYQKLLDEVAGRFQRGVQTQ